MDRTRLNTTAQYGNVNPVTAKSVTQIGLWFHSKAYSRNKRFFCTVSTHPHKFMVGLLGASQEAPVTFESGKTNPDNLTTIPDIGLSHGGSKLKGAYPMAITCRLAVMEGNSPRLSSRRIRCYFTHTFNNHSEARRAACQLNAVVCGWNVSTKATGAQA